MAGLQVTSYKPYNHRTDSIEKYIFNLNGKILKGKKITIHPNYITDSDTDSNFDLAIVELEDSINDVFFPILYDKYDELGKSCIVVAFGASGFGNSLHVESLSLKLAGNNVIDSIGGALYLGNYCQLFADFDALDYKISNELGDAIPLNLEFGTCGGDSGGPLFYESNEKMYLVGILSGGGLTLENIKHFSFYGQISTFTRVSTHKIWIENTIKK
ncbi:MAG: trypsin-like serine protease [Marinilabiliaceae bacterium]|nr:trypsin-like serine protease [Marinilabiliaceae bacterium]